MKSIMFAYTGSFRIAAESGRFDDILANDEIVVTSDSKAEMEGYAPPEVISRVQNKGFLYVNALGASYYSIASGGSPRYFPGPGDWQAQMVRTRRGVYCYKLDVHHLKRFYLALWNTINSFTLKSWKGVFVDDFASRKRPTHWEFGPGEKEYVWPMSDGEHREMMDDLEGAVIGFSGLRRKATLFNGPTDRGPRLFEGYGTWIDSDEVVEESRPGDALLVKGLAADGVTWAKVIHPYGGYEIGTSYLKVFKDAMELAEKRDLRLGLAFAERPLLGGSTLNIHAYTNPKTWGDLA